MLLLKIILFGVFFVDKSRLLLTRPPLLFITQPKTLYSLKFSRKLSLNLTKEFCGLPQLSWRIIYWSAQFTTHSYIWKLKISTQSSGMYVYCIWKRSQSQLFPGEIKIIKVMFLYFNLSLLIPLEEETITHPMYANRY